MTTIGQQLQQLNGGIGSWAHPNPDHCRCSGSGSIWSAYDTEHPCAYHGEYGPGYTMDRAASMDTQYQRCVKEFSAWSAGHGYEEEFAVAMARAMEEIRNSGFAVNAQRAMATAATVFFNSKSEEVQERTAEEYGYGSYSEMLWEENCGAAAVAREWRSRGY